MPSKEFELSTMESSTIGAITGLSEVLVTNPFFIIKTNIQQGKPIPWSIPGLYKGSFVNALGFIPITAIQVGSAQWMEQHVFPNASPYNQKVGSAFMAGVLSSVISCPVEMVMILQNNNAHLSMMQAAKGQVKQYGLTGLFIGQSATALREGIFSVFFLAVTPMLKSSLKPYCSNDAVSSVAAGVLSGGVATLVSQPMDTIKTMQQSSRGPSFGFFKTAKTIGLSNLLHGILSRSSGVIVSITLMSWMREQLEDYCEENHRRSVSNPKA